MLPAGAFPRLLGGTPPASQSAFSQEMLMKGLFWRCRFMGMTVKITYHLLVEGDSSPVHASPSFLALPKSFSVR